MRRTLSAETWEQAKTAFAAGIGLRELARNMNIPEGTVLARAKRDRWAQQIEVAKAGAARQQQSNAITPTPMQSASVTMFQRGQRHQERVASVTEKVLPHLERMPPDAILEGIHEIEKYDRMARRNYGMADGQGAGGSLNVHILAGQAAIQINQS